MEFIKRNRFWLYCLLTILTVSVFVLWPSFNLALTGDDYLGLWRYTQSMQSANWNWLSYWLTDYGPQDTITFLIHQHFGFQSNVYYFFSFLFRFIAALSSLPLVYYLTKNKWAAFLSGLFFAVSTIGLETTDWSFNMPSYIAIASLNFFILSYCNLQKKQSLTNFFVAIILFLLTIVIQPIRLAFLPFLVIALEFICIVLRQVQLKNALLRVGIFFVSFLLLIKGTGIGTMAGGISDKNGTGSIMATYVQEIGQLIAQKDIPKLLHPIGQLGSIVIPDTVITHKYDMASKLKVGTLILLPLLFFYCFFLFLSKYIFQEMKLKETVIACIIALIWTEYAFYILKIAMEYPYQTSQLLTTIIGGYIFITAVLLLWSYRNDKKVFVPLATSFLIIVLSYSISWLRNPDLINMTVGRYLIVASCGLALLVGLLFSMANHKKTFLICFLIPLFLIHTKASRNYLNNLASVRSSAQTEKIRSGLVRDTEADNNNVPSMYYFQSDNEELLHHTIMFGFPMFMYYYKDVKNPWDIGYTTSYKEVYDAFLDGSSLTRFGIKNSDAVPLEHIHGYKIESGELRDMTEELRKKLLEDTKKSKL